MGHMHWLAYAYYIKTIIITLHIMGNCDGGGKKAAQTQ